MLKAVRSILNEPSPDAVKCAVKILDEIIACQEIPAHLKSDDEWKIHTASVDLDPEAQQAQEEILGG